MIENEEQYRSSLNNILATLDSMSVMDLHIRYAYRHELEKQDDGKKKIEFITEEMEVTDQIRKDMFEKIKEEFQRKALQEIDLHVDYKLDSKIDDGQVGILEEESYPEELRKLLLSLRKPASEGKKRSLKETKKSDKIPVAFAIAFDGVVYLKRVKRIKLTSGKSLKKSYIAGTKSHKITKFEEDFLLLTFTDPDIVSYNKPDGSDPTLVYSSYNFNLICATSEFMLSGIKKDKGVLNKVIDDDSSLIAYLERTKQCVPSMYFMMNRKDFDGFDQKYIDTLNKKIFRGRLKLDGRRLKTEDMDGKEVYSVILEKYGSEYVRSGAEKAIIVENFSEVY